MIFLLFSRLLLILLSADGRNQADRALDEDGRSFLPDPRPGTTRSMRTAAPPDLIRGRELTGRSAFLLIS